jgi:hypothetical protein
VAPSGFCSTVVGHVWATASRRRGPPPRPQPGAARRRRRGKEARPCSVVACRSWCRTRRRRGVYGRLGRVLVIGGRRAVRTVLAGHARCSCRRGPYRSVQAVGVSGVSVVNVLRVLLVPEVLAVVKIPLLRTLRPGRRKRTHNPTRGNDKRHGYTPHGSPHTRTGDMLMQEGTRRQSPVTALACCSRKLGFAAGPRIQWPGTYFGA